MTTIQQFLEALKKEGHKIDDLDAHYYLELEKQIIIGTFKYAQQLHAMGDTMRAEQYYHNLINK